MKHRFGDFEFDTASGELRRNGGVVRLQAQPAQVLALLVEHAGEIVTRDAIRDAIWGQETFVDFDKGLNFAIAQIRAALGDSADAPKYIRTFPKRGYQFTIVSDTGLGWWRLGIRPVVVAVLVALAASGLFLWRWTARPHATPAPMIAVLHFDNDTGLSAYDAYAQHLTDALVAELTASGSGRFDVIGNAAVLRTPRDRRDIVAIGRSLNAGYLVLGQLQRDGSRVRILAHLIRLPEQTHLWVTRIDPAPQDSASTASEAAQRISSEFLRKL
jgi:DNA-binding winged helix-turn-helix (wHTH) protein/TolB-like protein